MASEGSREIDAARKRLAAARAQKSTASKMIDAADEMKEAAQRMTEAANSMAETARKMLETAKKNKEEAKKMETTANENKEGAQSLLQSSQSEVDEAEAFLKEAEMRWEVIVVVDSDGESEKAGRRNKKRKVAPAAAAVVEPTAAAGAGSAGDATGVEEIVVEGAGTAEVNGTYRRCRTDGSDALPSIYDSDYPVYSKGGSWKGRAAIFFVCRDNEYWYIECHVENHNDDIELFYRNEALGNNLPPKACWALICDGTHPAPQLQW